MVLILSPASLELSEGTEKDDLVLWKIDERPIFHNASGLRPGGTPVPDRFSIAILSIAMKNFSVSSVGSVREHLCLALVRVGSWLKGL